MFLFPSNFMKVIHIELPHKGGKVLMPEIHRKDIFLELFDVNDIETQSIFTPRN